ncbi:MAG: hypothetical protein KY468_04705 [Armatimonadetes bacterium]|nr:hypothetical protein [Armatimonadota bacterium]
MHEGSGRVIGGKLRQADGREDESQENRIVSHLLRDHLIKVAQREGGWVQLYVDPATGLYWELSYPYGEMHGGGPRC